MSLKMKILQAIILLYLVGCQSLLGTPTALEPLESQEFGL